MSDDSSSSLSEVVSKFGLLLSTFDKALKDAATAEEQHDAFKESCELLKALVNALSQKNSALSEFGAAVGPFDIGIPKKQIETFLLREQEFFDRLKLDPASTKHALDSLRNANADGLTASQLDSATVISALTELRDILCKTEGLTSGSFVVSRQLVKVCADALIDTLVIAGDTIGVATAVVGWPLIGAALVAVGSIQMGLKGLIQKLRLAQELLISETSRREQGIIKAGKRSTIRPRS